MNLQLCMLLKGVKKLGYGAVILGSSKNRSQRWQVKREPSAVDYADKRSGWYAVSVKCRIGGAIHGISLIKM